MSVDLASAWEWFTASPILGLTLTVATYLLARRLWELSGRRAVANPVLLAIVLTGGLLTLLDVEYSDYMEGGDYLLLLLGPATVALALPLHREATLVRRSAVPVLLGVMAGAVTSVAVAYLVVVVTGGDAELARSMAPKSATTPVSIALAESFGGVPALTAVFTILAGILGAVAAPALLSLLGFKDVRARGLAIGAVSHGIGTTRALEDDPTEGAFSSLAMGLTAVVTALVLPIFLALLP